MPTLLLPIINCLTDVLKAGFVVLPSDKFVITLISITIVFLVLTVLIGIYITMGKVANWRRCNRKQDSAESPADEWDWHDKESYVVTIRRKSPVISEPLSDIEYTCLAESSCDVADGQTGTSPVSHDEGRVIKSPLPGLVIDIKVTEGQTIREGQVLAVIEAMKMENDIESEFNGIVKAVHVAKGDAVLEGAVIITIK